MKKMEFTSIVVKMQISTITVKNYMEFQKTKKRVAI